MHLKSSKPHSGDGKSHLNSRDGMNYEVVLRKYEGMQGQRTNGEIPKIIARELCTE